MCNTLKAPKQTTNKGSWPTIHNTHILYQFRWLHSSQAKYSFFSSSLSLVPYIQGKQTCWCCELRLTVSFSGRTFWPVKKTFVQCSSSSWLPFNLLVQNTVSLKDKSRLRNHLFLFISSWSELLFHYTKCLTTRSEWIYIHFHTY